MSILGVAAVLLPLTAIFAYANHRWLRLPPSIGVMLIALLASLGLILLAALGLPLEATAEAWLRQIDFDDTVLQGMLSFLLFAGALHINVNELVERKWVIGSLATVGTLLSTLLVGGMTWLALGWLGVDLSFDYCLLFGALISPTDPIAVLSILRSAGVPKDIEIKITGESLFTTVYTNQGSGKRKVGFAAPYTGKIIPFDLSQIGGTLICQRDAFLCAAKGVSIGVHFQRRLGTGFFGGEGFIMQKLEGDGLAFVHAGGTIVQRDLAAGETLLVDTGCLVAHTASVSFDVQYVGKIKTALFGGEGLFLARLQGPGHVWIQSLPFSRLASRIFAAAPQRGGSREEGSVLGGGLLGGLMGDRSD